MKPTLKIKIPIPQQANWPDDWRFGVPGSEQNLVISRDESGAALSFVSDFLWTLTPYHPRKKTTRVSFIYWQSHPRSDCTVSAERLKNIRQMQHIMCHLMYSDSRYKIGITRLLAFSYVVRRIAIFAESNLVSVFEILANSEYLDKFIAEYRNVDKEGLATFLKILLRSKKEFLVATPTLLKALVKNAREYRDNQQQTTPLPTRVYSELITNFDEELSLIELHLPALIKVLKRLDHFYKTEDPKSWEYTKLPTWIVRESKVTPLLERYGNRINAKALRRLLNQIFMICKYQIHIFSGMRDSEVAYLPYKCMRTEKGVGRLFCLIEGVTTKLNKGRKRTVTWVTTDEGGFRAIRIVQKISDVIYASNGINPKTESIEKCPLFISNSYFPWAGKRVRLPMGEAAFKVSGQVSLSFLRMQELDSLLIPTIESEDIAELEEIEPFRDYRSDPSYQINSRWPITTHQLRRSIVLYARASGIVRLSSLRRQLQHYSNDMTVYYGKGCVFATDLINEDPESFSMHVARDWQDAEQEVETLEFDQEVIRSSEPLFGGAGNFYFVQMKAGNVFTREKVAQEIKNGTLSYTSTPVGGCTKVGPCDKKMGLAITNIVCVSQSCKNMVGKHSKLIKIIEAKQNFLSKISNDSIEYKLEQEELEALKTVEIDWRNKTLQISTNSGV